MANEWAGGLEDWQCADDVGCDIGCNELLLESIPLSWWIYSRKDAY